mmetsp:Transcript_50580/g.98909  ORF Transcript_50580/g.98909 Transcript_50580/m.98909 type:complete len:133 (+) Transcript_50580:208-606(+)
MIVIYGDGLVLTCKIASQILYLIVLLIRGGGGNVDTSVAYSLPLLSHIRSRGGDTQNYPAYPLPEKSDPGKMLESLNKYVISERKLIVGGDGVGTLDGSTVDGALSNNNIDTLNSSGCGITTDLKYNSKFCM